MISEHQFANSYPSVWNHVAPLSDGYWKIENMMVRRDAPPIISITATSMRGVINESAFRAFCRLRDSGGAADADAVLSAVDFSVAEAIEYIARLAPRSRINIGEFDRDCKNEAIAITQRLLKFFPGHMRTTLRPTFVGCGLISACEGDVIEGECLYEVKAGDRPFRITDLRQLLVYAALAYSSGSLSFKRIGLYNPRTGAVWIRTLDQVCQSIAGTRAIDTLSALVNQFSAVSTSR
ncbi:MAG: hypothetical protein JO142_21720 [Burkholderiales bacterium]|nr:hypothetical protein [Burkholderiales bacterium]